MDTFLGPKQPWNRQKVTYFKNDQNRSYDVSQGCLCRNLTKKVQKEVSQMANCNLPIGMLKGGLIFKPPKKDPGGHIPTKMKFPLLHKFSLCFIM